MLRKKFNLLGILVSINGSDFPDFTHGLSRMIFLVYRDAVAVKAIKLVFVGTIDLASEMFVNSS